MYTVEDYDIGRNEQLIGQLPNADLGRWRANHIYVLELLPAEGSPLMRRITVPLLLQLLQ